MKKQNGNDQGKLEFRGGIIAVFVPVLIFLFFCILYFVVYKAFEMYALAMGAFVGLLVGALFAKPGQYDRFWEAVYEGAREAIPVGILLLIIGMFSAMVKATNISTGFVWLAEKVGVGGGLFTAFTFFAVCVIATATGSSLGTMFTCFPIFYPAGVLMGSNPAYLAAAIVCGGIFGDNLAPISDTTIISAGTQEYTNREGMADVGGCVASRLKYSLAAGIPTFLLFWLLGGGGSVGSGAQEILLENMNPKPLVMLIPVAVMLGTAIVTRNIYKAITVGLLLGTVIGLATGLLTPASVISVADGAPVGFLTDGVSSMMATVVLVLSVYGIMGVLTAAGVLDRIAEAILESSLGKTARGTEIAMMLGISATTLIFGGVTSASMATFGKIQNEIGKRAGLHPYRRANLLDGFANAIVLAVPFLSVFVLIGSMLTGGYDFVDPVSLTQVAGHMIYCYLLFAVLLVSVITGWGRIYEGPDGKPEKR
ncbi:MAG: Na+/H+ antiporter NhaC family protein [Lachnospiraceae bacterium]|nr:Na+/H+ antiporter NhaC family protein [Lachnospiraceae bacterium]